MRKASTMGIAVHAYEVPMRKPFSHAAFSHKVSKGILVDVAAGEVRGWGEAAPRGYVTGEDVQSVVDDFERLDVQRLAFDLDMHDFGAALRVIEALPSYFADAPGTGRQAQSQAGNCTVAALELALLDTLLRRHGLSFADLHARWMGHAMQLTAQRQLSYTWVLDLDDAARLVHGDATWQAPRQLKIKVSDDLDAVCATLQKLRATMPASMQIVLDVNGGWTGERLIEAGRMLEPFGVACIEEPVAARDWSAMAAFRRQSGIRVMLDESATCEEDLQAAMDAMAFDVANVRLSKCGGFIRSMRLIRRLRQMGRQIYLGVHVGEVGPLWASQRMQAACMHDAFGVEVGKQDTWFEQPTTSPAYTADRSRHVADVQQGPGHGVAPSGYLMEHARALYRI